jgi:hypothetical protein
MRNQRTPNQPISNKDKKSETKQLPQNLVQGNDQELAKIQSTMADFIPTS